MTIYDRALKCSQTSTTSSNCSNYESIKGTDENNKNYRNETVCGPLGVYIDHVKPIVTQESGPTIHVGRKAKVSCSDNCNGNCSDYSDIKTFTASVAGQTKSNDSGETLAFNINSTGSYTMHVTCEDNAGNIAEDDLTFNVEEPAIDSISAGSNGHTCSNGCRLTDVRTTNFRNCSKWGYDCYCQDASCGTRSGYSGEYSTCCLSGSDPDFGCKFYDDSYLQTFSSMIPKGNVHSTYDGVGIIYYNSRYYIANTGNLPDDALSYDEGVFMGYKGSYRCTHYKCFLDVYTNGNHIICGTED